MHEPGGHARRILYLHLRAALGRAAMQAYIVLNGAAAAALLSFLGALSTQEATETRLVADLALVKFSLMCFTGGVCLAASTYFIAFAVHNHHIAGRHHAAEVVRRFGVVLSVAVLILFVGGVILSSNAITPR
jgi:hypothetical protein